MIQFFSKTKGSVSIFLVLVMLPMCSCVTLAIYAARIKNAENEFGELMDLAGNAVLSDYDRTLMELYGLTAVLYSDSSQNRYKKYVSGGLCDVYDFDVSRADVFALSDIENYEKLIKTSMKYDAPYSWISAISSKFSFFSQLSEIGNVIDKCSDYFDELSGVKDSVEDIYNSIAQINLNESNEDIVKKLKSVLKSAKKLTDDFEKIDEKSGDLKESVEKIESGSLKSLFKNECNSSSEYISLDLVKNFEKSLNDDIERISGLQEKADISDLSFTESPLYEYVTVSGSEEKGADDSGESENFKNALESISKFDFKEIYEKISDTDIRTLIGESTYTSIVGKEAYRHKSINNASFRSVGVSQAFVAEFLSDKFTCLTSDAKNRLWLPELEYIVFGSENMRTGVSLCVDSIFAIRVIFNSAFALTNTRMRQSALSIAAAVAGITGLGVTIAKNIILLSWAVAESVVDTYLLCRGDSIPLYKTASTWNLSFENVPKILEEGVENFVGKTVDDVFTQIEHFSAGEVSKVKSTVSSYVENTASGVAESVVSAITTPLENKILLITSGVKINYGIEDIKNILKNAIDEIPSDSEAMSTVKKFFLANCLDPLAAYIHERLPSVFSSDKEIQKLASDEIRKRVDSLYEELLKRVNSELDKAEESVNTEISKILNSASEDVKGRLNKSLSNYTKELSKWSGESIGLESDNKNEKDSASIFGSSGISMSYKDYLRLFIYVGLISDKSKDSLLRRSQVIMELNCKAVSPDFSILNCFTGVSLGGKIRVAEKEIALDKKYMY